MLDELFGANDAERGPVVGFETLQESTDRFDPLSASDRLR
jgi:hypothetical protein